jgi:hypothetical protein
VHVFEAALFSLLGTAAAAAGPPSTGTLRTGGYSGPRRIVRKLTIVSVHLWRDLHLEHTGNGYEAGFSCYAAVWSAPRTRCSSCYKRRNKRYNWQT